MSGETAVGSSGAKGHFQVTSAIVKSAGARLAWMDALRGIAALSTVAHHYFGPWIRLPNAFDFDFGMFGVAIFFCISGFIIPNSINMDKPAPLRAFLIGRFFRLYPSYWVSMAFGIAAFGASWLTVLANVTMFQRVFGISDIIGVYWTLQVELTYYLFVVATLYLGVFNRPKVVIGSLAGAVFLSIALGGVRFWLAHKAPVALSIGLVLILLGNVYRLHRADRVTGAVFIACLFGVIAGLLVTFQLSYSRDWGFNEHPGRFIISDGLALVVFFLTARSGRLNVRVLSWLGGISYSLYLLHMPVYSLLETYLGWQSKVATVALSIPVVLALSAMLHYGLEKRMIDLGRRIVRRPANAASLQPAN
jgi:peptidoglycan/LPS O-acetylase OafA/YrhL